MKSQFTQSMKFATLSVASLFASFNAIAGEGPEFSKISIAAQVAAIPHNVSSSTSSFEPSAISSPDAYYRSIMAPNSAQAAMGDLNNIVHVNDVKDLPSQFQGVIKLLPNKMYVISGIVNIGNSCINLNGAGLRGNDPGKDFIVSSVNGAVLRSTNVDVYTESVGVICATADTKAYDFQDLTGTKFCNLFSGTSVLDAPNIQSLGVGQLSGFNTTCIEKNFWRTKDGIKVTGSMGKFTSSLNYITGISSGAAIEFMPNAIVNDVIIQTSYFVFSGQTGIKVNNGAIIDQGRLALNLFRGVTSILSGFDSYTPGWEMLMNGVGVPDSKGSGYVYMNENSAPTGFKSVTLFTKIQGQTKVLKSNKFTTPSSNKFVFTGKRQTSMNVFANISATASANDEGNSYSIALMKNGTEIILPNSSVSNIGKGHGFQLNLQTQIDLVSGDYIEVYIKSNTNTTPIVISDLLFKVSE